MLSAISYEQEIDLPMNADNTSFEIGDSVKVKHGVMCPDYEKMSIEGWQGRVIEIDQADGKELIGIRWDSITLQNMSAAYIDDSEEEGLDYSVLYLWPEELEPAKSRDSKENVEITLQKMPGPHSKWWGLGEQRKRINDVLAGIDEDDLENSLKSWKTYLAKKLSFPFRAKVSEYQPYKSGTTVMVKKIIAYNERYGIIVELKRGEIPLCEIEAIKINSPNYQLIEDYCTWFANV